MAKMTSPTMISHHKILHKVEHEKEGVFVVFVLKESKNIRKGVIKYVKS